MTKRLIDWDKEKGTQVGKLFFKYHKNFDSWGSNKKVHFYNGFVNGVMIGRITLLKDIFKKEIHTINYIKKRNLIFNFVCIILLILNLIVLLFGI